LSLIGCVDILTETCISGWAADASDFGLQVFVDILVNALPVATIRAAAFRDDLRQAGIGDGCKSFRFDPSPYLKPGRNDVEVRHAGTDQPVERGRDGLVSPYADCLIAALQTRYRFNPLHHICEIAPGSGVLQKAILELQLPFRKFTSVELSSAASVCLPEKADLIVCSAFPYAAGTLKNLVVHNTNRPACLAIALSDSDDAAAEIRRAIEECDSHARVSFESGRFAFAELGVEALEKAESVPLLAHIHVPKCAGTSFRILLERYFGPRHMRLYTDDTYFVYSHDALRNCVLRDPPPRAFSSHHVRTFPRWLAGREMLYVTFLRDPVQQVVSYMTHIQKHYAGITSASLLEAVPPDARRLTLREFARWLLTQDRDIPFRENYNVNFFARHSAPPEADRLEAAKVALSGFFFVGISDRMDESMDKLRELVQAAGLDFPPDPVPVLNTSSEFRDDLSWIDPADEVGSLLLRSVEQDRQLYDWAVARLDQSPKNRLELSVGLA
jgi:sulfotransferase famil protein